MTAYSYSIDGDRVYEEQENEAEHRCDHGWIEISHDPLIVVRCTHCTPTTARRAT